MVESKRFMAPDGRFCASRVDALRYFKKTGGGSFEEFCKMKEGLKEEGWVKSERAPRGWYVQSNNSSSYMTPNYEVSYTIVFTE